MAKFESSQYNKLWDSIEGREVMYKILNDPELIHSNHTFWASKFRVDPQVTPTNPLGRATFTSYMRKNESGVMMDMRAPLGDSTPAEKGNLSYYTGHIPDFIAKGFVETAPERMYKEKLFDQFGDAHLLAAFATDELQRMVDAANQTLSNMAAQLISKGCITYGYGEGIQGNILKAEIPTENFLKAGVHLWSDHAKCKLLDQLRKMYEDIRNHLGFDIELQLEITRNQWNSNFLTNDQVKEWVRYYNSLNNVLLPTNMVVTTDMAKEAIERFEGIPKIVIIEESQKDITSGIVHGWDDNTAVLRPVGYAGYIRHTTILDEEVYGKYGNNLVTRNFSKTLFGMATVMNSVVANGNLKEWHTDLMLSAIPSLDEFLWHFIVDTTKTSPSTF